MRPGSKSKTPLLMLLAVALALAGCGGGGGRKDPDSFGDADGACPCFSAQDVMDDAQGRSFEGCISSPNELGLTLQFAQGNAGIVLSVDCPNAVFGQCQCVDGVRNVESNSVTQDQYFSCVGILTDAIVNEFSASTCLIGD